MRSFLKDCIVIPSAENCIAIAFTEDCIVLLVARACIVILGTKDCIAILCTKDCITIPSSQARLAGWLARMLAGSGSRAGWLLGCLAALPAAWLAGY